MTETTIIPYLLVSLLAWWAVWMVYWHGVRRYCLVRLKKHIDALKASLARESDEVKSHPSYEVMMNRLTWSVSDLTKLRVSAMLVMDYSQDETTAFNRSEMILKTAPSPAIAKSYQKLLIGLVGAVALNAPFLVFVLAGAVVTFAWTSKFRKTTESLMRRIFRNHEGNRQNSGSDYAHA